MGNGFLVAQLTATVSLIGGHWTGEVDETTGADVPEALSDNGVGETRVAGLVVVAEKSLIGGRVDTAPADRDYRGGWDSQSVVHPGGGPPLSQHHLPPDQKQRERHADRDEETQRHIDPHLRDADPPRLDHHEYECRQPEQQ